jgi:hypothetical protein
MVMKPETDCLSISQLRLDNASDSSGACSIFDQKTQNYFASSIFDNNNGSSIGGVKEGTPSEISFIIAPSFDQSGFM